MIDWHNSRLRTLCFGLVLWAIASVYFAINTLPTRLVVDLVADTADVAQLFYSSNGMWNEAESETRALVPGWNRVTLTLPPQRSGANVRFDPGQHATTYRILAMRWKRGGVDHAIALNEVVNPRTEFETVAVVNDELQLRSGDNDAQLLVPMPGWNWCVASAVLPLGVALVGLLLVLYLGIRRNISPLRMATVFLGICALFYFVACITVGPRLPLYDDWRYLYPGPFSLIDGGSQWLTVAGNDTYFLTNQLLDFVVLKFSNIDFFWLRNVALSLLMLQLVMQYRIITRAANLRPFVAAVGVALGIWSLTSGSYWGGTAIAYQQALPTIFGTLMLAQLVASDGSLRSRISIPLLVLCCLASGLSYISGGMLIMSLGVAALLMVDWRRPVAGTRRTGWILLGLGAALLILQLVIVSRLQGSLLEHNHAVASVYPNDRRFWWFFFSLYGRALGYTGLYAPIDALLALLMLFPALLFGIERLRALRGKNDPPLNRTWQLLALYAGIGSFTYAAMIAFGRAGFVPQDASMADIVATGKGRFHYWPIAAMLPYAWLGWADIIQRLQRGANAVAVMVATLMLVPKSLVAFANTTYMDLADTLARAGAHCVVAHLADIEANRPVVCTVLTGSPLDMGLIVNPLRERNSPTYITLIEQGGLKKP